MRARPGKCVLYLRDDLIEYVRRRRRAHHCVGHGSRERAHVVAPLSPDAALRELAGKAK